MGVTSAFRTQPDQDRINRDYAIKYRYTGDLQDSEDVNKFNKAQGLKIAHITGRGHGGKSKTGAFDLAPEKGSNISLDLIWAAVEAGNRGLQGKIKYSPLNRSGGNSSIIERVNNCVHVAFFLEDITIQTS